MDMGERDVRDIVRRLEREGWVLSGGKGSHKWYVKRGRPGISLPTSDKELQVGIYRNIAKKAGWIK